MKTLKTLTLLFISLFITNNAFCADGLIIDQSGNVGIGRNRPTDRLDIQSAGPNTYPIKIRRENGSLMFFFSETSRGDSNFYMRDSTSTNKVKLSSNGHTYLTGGNVGIGTLSPRSVLEVVDNVSDYSKGTKINIVNEATPNWYNGDVSAGIDFYKESTLNAYMRVIHTRSGGPHSYEDAGLVFGTAHGNSQAVDRLVITHRGSVGIGNVSPAYKLDVSGNAQVITLLETSDARLKKDIKTLGNTLGKISQLRGVSYRWNEEIEKEPIVDEMLEAETLKTDLIEKMPAPALIGRTRIGLLAQEVEEIFPEVVYTDDMGMKSIAYTHLIGPLIEAVKDLKFENETLRADIETNRQEIQALKALVSK